MGTKFLKQVPALEAVPEPFRGFYTPTEDGSFEMPDAIYEHLDNSKLASALDSERKSKGELERALKGFKHYGDTPEAIAEKLAAAEELAKKAPAEVREFEKQKKEILDQTSKALSAKDQEIVNMRQSLEAHLLDSQALSAMTAEDCDAPELLMDAIHKNTRVVREADGSYHIRVVDAEGDPRGDGKGGFMTIRDLVKEFKEHPTFGRAFKPKGIQGSGMPPRSGSQSKTAMPRGEMTPMQKIAAGLKAQGN